jgi:shikimate kinase
MLQSPESREVMRTPVIAITGFMAAGKSSVGRSLGWLLRRRCVDLDSEIEARCRRSIREIFLQQGEAEFRAIEADVLRTLLDNVDGPVVIALGGGTFVQPQNAELLRSRGAHVIFLDVAIEQLLRRCSVVDERAMQNPRPLAEDDATLRNLHAQRIPFYRRADTVVNGNDKTPEQIALEIAQALNLLDPAASSR